MDTNRGTRSGRVFERSGASQIGDLIVKALRDQKLGLAMYLK